jgi:hypothetical protein
MCCLLLEADPGIRGGACDGSTSNVFHGLWFHDPAAVALPPRVRVCTFGRKSAEGAASLAAVAGTASERGHILSVKTDSRWSQGSSSALLQVVPLNALRYDTEVPYPEENAFGQPVTSNGQAWMGTNVAYYGANGGGNGWARKPNVVMTGLRQARLSGLALEDRVLPIERIYEEDGVQPSPKCPGAWCDEDPWRAFPDSRGAWPAGRDFALNWGPCNIALQDC